jgi:hypothetical protein
VTASDSTAPPTGTEILAVPLPTNDANAATVREYLVALVREVWRYDECFDGKRPFGNSGWQSEVYDGLAVAGLDDGDATVMRAIEALGESQADAEKRAEDRIVAWLRAEYPDLGMPRILAAAIERSEHRA